MMNGSFHNKEQKKSIVAITPNILFGIHLNTQYIDKNYHSGVICNGVFNGFALIQFSASINIYGWKNIMYKKKNINIVKTKRSLQIVYLKNGNLNELFVVVDVPFKWSK